MIAFVKGVLDSILDDSIIVDVHGIGYEVICPNPFIFQDRIKEEIKIHTYQHVREDIQALYGFKNMDEKHLFMKLISVSGIGPRGALGILGSVDIPDFVAAVEREDDKYLTSFPGVGKKTSRQIILDLKGKLTNLFELQSSTSNQAAVSSDTNIAFMEAKEALKALGYAEREIQSIAPQLQQSGAAETDTIIRNALALLMKK